jgi:hypothetical protein
LGHGSSRIDLSEFKETLSDQPAFRRLRPFAADRQVAAAAEDAELRYHTLVLAPNALAVGQAVRDLELPHDALLVAGDRGTLFAPPRQLPGAAPSSPEHPATTARRLDQQGCSNTGDVERLRRSGRSA